MQVQAVAKYIRISPQKARLVADQIRLKPVDQALELLESVLKKQPRRFARHWSQQLLTLSITKERILMN